MPPIENFPGNTNRDKDKAEKAVEKKVEKVVTGEVVQRKKPIGRRFREVFLGGEFKSASRYIAVEVLLPAVRNMVVDATTKGIERVIYGESAPRRHSYPTQSRMQYNSPVQRRDPAPIQRGHLPDQPSSRRRIDAGDIILMSRDEAELVLERMNDIIDQFQVASIADLHELLGLPSTYVDDKWGWVNLHYANIRQIREGYLLELPPAEAL